MNIGIIGAGAMGSLLGFYLSARAEVWLLSHHQAHIEAIATHGLRCERDGIEEVRHPHITSDLAAIGPCDVVLVLVKSHQTAWAGEQARLLARTEGRGPRTESGANTLSPQSSVFSPLVVTLQNGLGNREILVAALGEHRVGQGVTTLGATLLGPGRVRHAGQGLTVFGTASDPAGMMALAELFEACGLPSELTDDLDGLIWGKLVANAGINALSALLRVPNGALAATPQARALLERSATEAAAVAAARGVRLPYADPAGHALAVAQATGANRSSTLQDVLRGSPTEIDAINGAVAREGRHLGIPTPVNALLAELVAALEATAGARVEEVEKG
jgi:2-dehydropantoate 2-reductase